MLKALRLTMKLYLKPVNNKAKEENIRTIQTNEKPNSVAGEVDVNCCKDFFFSFIEQRSQ